MQHLEASVRELASAFTQCPVPGWGITQADHPDEPEVGFLCLAVVQSFKHWEGEMRGKEGEQNKHDRKMAELPFIITII